MDCLFGAHNGTGVISPGASQKYPPGEKIHLSECCSKQLKAAGAIPLAAQPPRHAASANQSRCNLSSRTKIVA